MATRCFLSASPIYELSTGDFYRNRLTISLLVIIAHGDSTKTQQIQMSSCQSQARDGLLGNGQSNP